MFKRHVSLRGVLKSWTMLIFHKLLFHVTLKPEIQILDMLKLIFFVSAYFIFSLVGYSKLPSLPQNRFWS